LEKQTGFTGILFTSVARKQPKSKSMRFLPITSKKSKCLNVLKGYKKSELVEYKIKGQDTATH